MARINNRNKQRSVVGYCDTSKGKIYFYGKATSVSDKQAHYFICCAIRDTFQLNEFIEPVIQRCETFTSSDWLVRNKVPERLSFYKDAGHKELIGSATCS